MLSTRTANIRRTLSLRARPPSAKGMSNPTWPFAVEYSYAGANGDARSWRSCAAVPSSPVGGPHCFARHVLAASAAVHALVALLGVSQRARVERQRRPTTGHQLTLRQALGAGLTLRLQVRWRYCRGRRAHGGSSYELNEGQTPSCRAKKWRRARTSGCSSRWASKPRAGV